MNLDDQQSKMVFTPTGAWLGFIAYVVFILMIVALFIF